MAMRVPTQIGVVDWNLRALGAEKLIEVLRAQENAPRVVVFGQDSAPASPRRAVEAGAAAFVARSASSDKLVQTCLDVTDGKMVFPFLERFYVSLKRSSALERVRRRWNHRSRQDTPVA